MYVGSITINSPSSGRVPVLRMELRVGCTLCASLVCGVHVEIIRAVPQVGLYLTAEPRPSAFGHGPNACQERNEIEVSTFGDLKIPTFAVLSAGITLR
jgi:hypothetical protein